MRHVAPCSRQQPKKELSYGQYMRLSAQNKKHTIEETKCQEVCNT